jgi:hypothetical protein
MDTSGKRKPEAAVDRDKRLQHRNVPACKRRVLSGMKMCSVCGIALTQILCLLNHKNAKERLAMGYQGRWQIRLLFISIRKEEYSDYYI